MKKIYWVISMLWMCLIFYFSNQPASISDAQSDMTIGVINYITSTDIIEINNIDYIVRKTAHFSLYFILSILMTLSIESIVHNKNNSYKLGAIISVVYSMSDEFHQMFTPGRGAQIKDVGIDSLGIVCGILILKFIEVIKKEVV
ncbi:VanZ family protein [Tepidibacter aestuarii]|uniref:VanZ family protein n=1 Tax=Tepidibacter aestuarii TaxID=2925782 RepID=UPI0020C04FA8|nr:VanZ family protein [Tepidibacter aestuarii]CAH2215055.1 putative integral membrane protein [Tepidibacter aestuarii]